MGAEASKKAGNVKIKKAKIEIKIEMTIENVKIK